nr:immunoglobulin heavy chain junction region [Macaca mulatta]
CARMPPLISSLDAW